MIESMSKRLSFAVLVLSFFSDVARSSPVLEAKARAAATTTAPSTFVTAVLDGVSYINKGLVGFGLIPADFVDSIGDTMGGFGSAIAFKPGTWQPLANGSFSGTIVAHPDRGFNV